MASFSQLIITDLGYGDGKFGYFKDGTFVWDKFPTAVVRAKEHHLDLGAAGNDNTYLYNGKRYIVGKDALYEAKHTRDYEFLEEFGPLMVYVAIEKAGYDIKKPIVIGTGLSILDWSMYERFTKALKNIHVNGNKIIVESLELYAQGQGVYADSKATGDMVCVVDIGYNTLDYLVFKNGKPSVNESDATVMGVHNMTERIRSLLTKRLPRMRITEQFAKECFVQGYYTFGGETYDISKEVEAEKEEYSKDLIALLKRDYGTTFNFADQIVFAGGGAYHLDKKALPKNAIFCSEPYEYANIRGYMAMLIKARDGKEKQKG